MSFNTGGAGPARPAGGGGDGGHVPLCPDASPPARLPAVRGFELRQACESPHASSVALRMEALSFAAVVGFCAALLCLIYRATEATV